MKRLIFINLLIDRFWGKGLLLDRVFNVTNPESMRLSLISNNLSIYFDDGNPKNYTDFYILSIKPDSYWIKQFSIYHSLELNNFKIINYDPYLLTKWIDDFKTQTADIQFSEVVFSGISEFEVKLNETVLNLNLDKSSEVNQKNMNSKRFLIENAEKYNIPIPESQIYLGQNINFDDLSLKDKVFKFDISSGGAGQFDLEKLKLIRDWAQARNLNNYWDSSFWICQKKIFIQNEMSVFSHTSSDGVDIAQIKYDNNHLSNRHYFNHKMDGDLKVNKLFADIKKCLLENEYKGFFGFDVIVDVDGRYFVVDLNLRLTKTHLLKMALRKWKIMNSVSVFYRKRFILSDNILFHDFWLQLISKLYVNQNGEGLDFRILPFDVSGYSVGKCEITFLIDSVTQEKADELIFQINQAIGGIINAASV